MTSPRHPSGIPNAIVGDAPRVRAAIVGASGYAGAELAGILAGHADAELVGLFGSDRPRDGRPEETRLADLYPRFEGAIDLPILPLSRERLLDLDADCVFLATPHELSHDLAPELLAAGVVTFDLSAAFRLPDASLYPKFYGFEHAHPDLLASAVYGLPELLAPRIARANLIAVPGCYPTSAILPVRPLADGGLLRGDREVIVDSTSGVSGAGRKAETKSLFCEVSLQAYGVLRHRHRPEIATHSGMPVMFTPHLGPFDRGILSTIHCWLRSGVSEQDVRACLEHRYADAPFVRLLGAGRWPSVAAVRGTNCCDIAMALEDDHLILESAIDNLVKGAAGQAVQCMNLRFGLPETLGLPRGLPAATGLERASTIADASADARSSARRVARTESGLDSRQPTPHQSSSASAPHVETASR